MAGWFQEAVSFAEAENAEAEFVGWIISWII